MKTFIHFLFPITGILCALSVAGPVSNDVQISRTDNTNAAPNIELTDVQPIDKSGNVVYLTSAPKASGEKETALLSVYLKMKNKEGKTVKVEKVTYTIGNIIRQYTGATLKDNIKGGEITWNSNESLVWQNNRGYHELGSVIKLTVPFPKSVSIKIYVEGNSTPYVISKNLKRYLNDLPGNAYAFPAKEKDMGYGEYWNGAATHGGGSQVFAYDLGVKGWDTEKKEWSSLYPGKDKSKNENYRCYGKPVYAMADGDVESFIGNLKENPVPGEKLQEVLDVDYGGNNFVINHGNETIKYSHFQTHSLNRSLMKKGTKVKKGDFLGLLGNSGNSTNPHLHLDKRSPFGPIQFKDTYILDETKLDGPDPDGAWVKTNKEGIPYDRVMIWPSAAKPCWYARGWSEIGRHGIAEKDYQKEFDKAWGCGYYPEWVDGYDVNGKTYFNVIFRYNENGYQIAARHNMTSSGYQAEYNKWVKKNGFRLLQLDNYLDQGNLKISAIFIKKPGNPSSQPAYHATSPSDHQKMFNDYTGKGYVPVNVSVTSVNGKLYYAAFYEKRNVGGSVLKSSLSQKEYQDLFDDMSKKNWEQVYVNAYHHNGQTKFSAIWYQKSGFGSYSATRKSSSDNYQEKYEENTTKGRLTQCVTGYEEGNKHWFAAIWAK